MVQQKPSLLIFTDSPDTQLLKEVLAGVEEEGVLYEVEPRPSDTAEHLAANACASSVLGAGIGINATALSLFVRGAEKETEVFHLISPDKKTARILGMNGARAIKKTAFID